MQLANHYRDQIDAFSEILIARARLIQAIPLDHHYDMAKQCRAYARDYTESQRLLKEYYAELHPAPEELA